MYLLDTCIMIPLFKGKNGIQERIVSVGIGRCCISELVLAELLVGAYKSGRRSEMECIRFARETFTVLPLSSEILDAYARLRARLEAPGLRIDRLDLLLAATALENDAVLVTHNVQHFSRIPGLRTEDWIQ